MFDDWWNLSVVNILSFQQKRRLEQQKITSLRGLDLAGLLRVLDQNWYQISNRLNFTPEDRHFVKEMLTVRNRWAHANTEGSQLKIFIEILDTIQRLRLLLAQMLN